MTIELELSAADVSRIITSLRDAAGELQDQGYTILAAANREIAEEIARQRDEQE